MSQNGGELMSWSPSMSAALVIRQQSINHVSPEAVWILSTTGSSYALFWLKLKKVLLQLNDIEPFLQAMHTLLKNYGDSKEIKGFNSACFFHNFHWTTLTVGSGHSSWGSVLSGVSSEAFKPYFHYNW